MARRARKPSPRRIALIVVGLAVILGLWLVVPRFYRQFRESTLSSMSTTNVPADRVDPANDGRRVRVTGKLEAGKPPRDMQLGVGTDAPLLFRHVEMYQWHEHCERGACRYDSGWFAQRIDSRKFQVPTGHENPAPPFADAYFADVRLGAFAVDVDLASAQLATTDYPVHATALPPNLLATFREVDGVLYAGGDPAHPAVGAIRVSYRIVPSGTVTLTGVQHGAKLMVN
jgi:hypothetical protein